MAIRGRRPRHALPLDQAEGHVFPYRKAVEQGGLLEQHADFRIDRFAFVVADTDDGLTVDFDAAGIRGQQPENAFQRYRFAAAGAADDDDRFAGHDVERHIVENDVVAELLAHMLQSDLWSRHMPKNIAEMR